MSTRSQIDFVSKYKLEDGTIKENRVRVYRHSDGYPEGVVPDIKAFLKWAGLGRMNDVEYNAANFIYWSKAGYVKDGFAKRDDNKPLLGFGVCNPADGWHGDIEYWYEVVSDIKEFYLNVYEVGVGDPTTMASMKLIEKISLGDAENESKN